MDIMNWLLKLWKIYSHFGIRTQKDKTKEELLELRDALIEEDEEHILEEMADVIIMLLQLVMFGYWSKRTKLIRNIKGKITRTDVRIQTGYYDQKE